MRMKTTAMAACALAIAPAAAFASDLPSRSAPAALLSPVPVANWAGPYAGAYIAGGLGEFSTRRNASGVGASASGFGFASGALVGYNWQTGAFVYGLESDIGYNLIRGKFSARPGFPANQASSVYSLEARGRLGYDFGVFMPYLAGGLVYSRIDQSLQQPFDYNGAAHTGAGWTIGAGVDAKVMLPILGPSVLRAEYVYQAMPNSAYNLNGPTFSTRLSTNYARLALISRIGDGWTASPTPAAGDWGGAYFGAIGGGQWQRISAQGAGGFSANGANGGVYAGHNWMFGDTMLGLDGATMIANVAGGGSQPGAPTTSYRNYLTSDFRGRVGYAFGRFMPYLAAGLGFDDAEEMDHATGRSQGNVASVLGEAAVGVDYMASERIALRAEYVYAHTLSPASTHLDSENCCDQSHGANSLRFGVAYFFH
jgi:Outer membrane protein beta-barrel domain